MFRTKVRAHYPQKTGWQQNRLSFRTVNAALLAKRDAMPDYDRAIGSRPGITGGDRTRLIRPGPLWIASITVFCLFTATPGYGQNLPTTAAVENATVTVIQAQEIVSRATLEAVRWSGPESGPQALRGKSIAFVAEDLRNGGIVGVAQGAREAAKAMGWTLKIFDDAGSSACLLYTSPSPRDQRGSRMPSSA